MFLRLETLKEKKLIGKHSRMSFAENSTFELWNWFMTRRKEIKNVIGAELYSAEVYPPSFFVNFNPAAPFEKWALAEVSSFDNIPAEMETIVFPAGLYAVFLHKGPADEGEKTYRFIFESWLPQSGFTVDNRPHFAVMGENYQHNEYDNEEEIWVPVKTK